MSERDEDLSAALANLPIPEPSEQFWEDLRLRCVEAFNDEASPPDVPPEDTVLRLEETPLRTPDLEGREPYVRLTPEWDAVREPRRSRPAWLKGSARPPKGPVSEERPRARRPRLSPTMAIAALVVFLAGSLVLLLHGLGTQGPGGWEPARRSPDDGGGVRLVAFSPECGHDGNVSAGGDRTLEDRSLVVAGVWQKGSTEAENFVKVLQRFAEKTGEGIVYAYQQTSRSIGADLKIRSEAKCPPDVALLPSIGLLRDLAHQKELRALRKEAAVLVDKNYTPAGRDVGVVDDVLYGVWFKAANKSMIWYRPDLFQTAGVEPPDTWSELQAVAARLHDRGLVPFSVAGSVGWTLTDWFENVYLATAGPEMYDKLAKHEIPWTDPTVKHALATLAEVFGKPEWLSGGTDGALKTTYEVSVADVVRASSNVAMVYEGDFVAGAARDVSPGVDGNATLRSFDFPAIEDSKPLVAGGDIAVSLTDNPAGRKLLEFLATPEAAEIWAKEGGFISPNKNVDPKVYPDEASRRAALVLSEGKGRFDLSDLQPPAFGVKEGSGMWQILQDFLRNPRDVDGITERLEKAAEDAWHSCCP